MVVRLISNKPNLPNFNFYNVKLTWLQHPDMNSDHVYPDLIPYPDYADILLLYSVPRLLGFLLSYE